MPARGAGSAKGTALLITAENPSRYDASSAIKGAPENDAEAS